MRYKKVLSILLCICLLLTLGPGAAFAATQELKALSNTEQALYGYTEPADVYIRLTNTLDNDVEIKSIASTNEEDFTADLTTGFTVASGAYYDYAVKLNVGKEPGEYAATYTFTDAAGATYQATAKVNIVEDVILEQEAVDPVVWDYEEPITAQVTIKNCTKKDVKLVGSAVSSADFEIEPLSAEKSITIASKGSAVYNVTLPIGKDVGVYTTTLTLTDEEGTTYEQEVSIEVVKRLLTVPAITGEYIYNAANQKLLFDENWQEKYMGVSLDVSAGIQNFVQAKDAGHYAPVLVLKDKKNTAWLIDETETTVNQTISWDIAKYQLPKPTPADIEYEYDGKKVPGYVYTGSPQDLIFDDYTETVFTGTPQETAVLETTGGTKTYAGSSEVTVSILDITNFEWEDETDAALTYTWVMDRAKVKEPEAVTTNYDYDGSAKSIEFKEGSINEELMTVSGNSRTDIGTQDVTVALKDKVNYVWSAGNDEDLVFTLAVGTPVYNLPAITGTYVYTGQTQQPAFTGFDEEHMIVTDNDGKNAGTYTITISLKDKAHATWADTNTNEDRTLTWTIDKAKVKVEAKAKTAKTGDPVPALHAEDYVITGMIKPDSLGFIPAINYSAAPDMSKAGEYDIIVSGPAASTDGNYAVTYTNAKLTVGQAQQTETPGSSGSIGGGGGIIVGGGGGIIVGGGSPGEVTPVNPVSKVQEPVIKVDRGTTYAVSRDGTAVTFTPAQGFFVKNVTVNGASVGAAESVTGLKTGDVVACSVICKADVQKQMNKYQLAARSKMSRAQGKKAVKINWYDENGKKLKFDGVEIFRSVKRCSGYTRKPFFTTTKSKYYNTAMKAGARYYYKVRGYVWFNGEKVYTPWSLKALRYVE